MSLPSDFNSAFFIAVGTMIIGFCGLMVRYGYKNKCSEVTCCCIHIKRDVQQEVHGDMEEMKAMGRKQSLDIPASPKMPASV